MQVIPVMDLCCLVAKACPRENESMYCSYCWRVWCSEDCANKHVANHTIFIFVERWRPGCSYHTATGRQCKESDRDYYLATGRCKRRRSEDEEG